MNVFNKNLLVVLIASAVSTSLFAMDDGQRRTSWFNAIRKVIPNALEQDINDKIPALSNSYSNPNSKKAERAIKRTFRQLSSEKQIGYPYEFHDVSDVIPEATQLATDVAHMLNDQALTRKSASDSALSYGALPLSNGQALPAQSSVPAAAGATELVVEMKEQPVVEVAIMPASLEQRRLNDVTFSQGNVRQESASPSAENLVDPAAGTGLSPVIGVPLSATLSPASPAPAPTSFVGDESKELLRQRLEIARLQADKPKPRRSILQAILGEPRLVLLLAAADVAHAYITTPKEELKDKGIFDKAKAIAQRTYTVQSIMGAVYLTKKGFNAGAQLVTDLRLTVKNRLAKNG